MASLRTLVKLTTGVILGALTAAGQTSHPDLPCAFDGSLLRDSRAHIVQFTSDEMKERATAKEDLNGFIKQLDFRTVMVLRLIVSESGKVVCVKTISGMPMARRATEEAVQRWKFRVASKAGRPVSYIGWLEFKLCSTACGSDEYGVTLLK
jgi:hypothetical protein